MKAILMMMLAVPATFSLGEGAAAENAEGAEVTKTSSKPMTLEQAWQRAEQETPLLKAQLKKIKSLEGALAAQPRWYLPELYLQAGYTGAVSSSGEVQHGPLARLVSEWTLWDGGRTHYGNAYREKLIESEQARNRFQLYQVKSRIARLYFQASYLPAHTALQAAKQKEIENLLVQVKKRVRLGRIGVSDVRQLEAELKRQQLTNDALALERELAVRGFQTLLGLTKPPALPEFSSLSVQGVTQVTNPPAFANLPWVIFRKSKIAALDAQIEAENRALYWPRFSTEIYGGYGPHRDAIESRQPEVGAGLKVEMPLFSNRDRAARIKSIELDVQSQKLLLKQELLEAKLEYDALLRNFRLLQQQSQQLADVVAEQKKNLSLGYREFSRGVKSYSDMQGNIQSYYESQLALLQMKSRHLLLAVELHMMHTIVDKMD